MLYKFGSAELPGAYKPGHAQTDLATFEEIYKTARRLESNCIVGQGVTRSLGLFFWATESRINRDPRFREPFAEAGERGNITLDDPRFYAASK
ncbi:MAG: hypothetical protein Q9208_004367 [Pyrenodesmia sp. 3 TL-2023]